MYTITTDKTAFDTKSPKIVAPGINIHTEYNAPIADDKGSLNILL